MPEKEFYIILSSSQFEAFKKVDSKYVRKYASEFRYEPDEGAYIAVVLLFEFCLLLAAVEDKEPGSALYLRFLELGDLQIPSFSKVYLDSRERMQQITR